MCTRSYVCYSDLLASFGRDTLVFVSVSQPNPYRPPYSPLSGTELDQLGGFPMEQAGKLWANEFL